MLQGSVGKFLDCFFTWRGGGYGSYETYLENSFKFQGLKPNSSAAEGGRYFGVFPMERFRRFRSVAILRTQVLIKCPYVKGQALHLLE